MRRLTAAVAALEARLLVLRASMTSGQRWTAAIALLLACAVLVLGRPRTG